MKPRNVMSEEVRKVNYCCVYLDLRFNNCVFVLLCANDDSRTEYRPRTKFLAFGCCQNQSFHCQ